MRFFCQNGPAPSVDITCLNDSMSSPATLFSQFVKTLDPSLAGFHWQDGYGLFSIRPSHRQARHNYVLNQQQHHQKETFQEEYLRILKKYGVEYDERYLWD